jgi:2-keto-4-pentenoate hydratase/2-oxohepta-3-ene-1,7-dioic acid hydratase in catechol pathway
MIFSVDYLVSYITKYFPLNPGDVILTGTPGGVIVGYPPEKRVWIKPGDRTEVCIEKLGSLLTDFI